MRKKVSAGANKTSKGKKPCSLRRGVLLRLFPPFLALLFLIGIWLAIEPTTRYEFIVIYVPVYAFICILYGYVVYSSDHIGVTEDEVVISPVSPLSIVVDNVTGPSARTGIASESGETTILATDYYGDDDDKEDETYLFSTVGDVLSGAFSSIGGTFRKMVHHPWLPSNSLACQGDYIKENASLGEKAGDIIDDDIIDNTLTQDQLTITSCPLSNSEKGNLSGTFKLVSSHNFDAFLKAMGVPWALRKAANLAKPVHTYTHTADTFRVQIDGVIKGDTTYTINGPPINSTIRHIKLIDTASYLDSGDGVMVRKVAQNPKPGDPTVLLVKRHLSSDRTHIRLLSKAIFPDGSESTESEQVFQRVVI